MTLRPITARNTLAVLLTLFVVAALESWPERRSSAYFQGFVYEHCVDGRPVGPVEGADVSTSIDATTTKSDATGHFELTTAKPLLADQSYHVTVRAHGQAVSDQFQVGPTSPVHPGISYPIGFVLFPPQPVGAFRRAVAEHRPVTPDEPVCVAEPVS